MGKQAKKIKAKTLMSTEQMRRIRVSVVEFWIAPPTAQEAQSPFPTQFLHQAQPLLASVTALTA